MAGAGEVPGEKTPPSTPSTATSPAPAKKAGGTTAPAGSGEKTPAETPPPITPSKDEAKPGKAESSEPAASQKPAAPAKPKGGDDELLEPAAPPGKATPNAKGGDDLLLEPGNAPAKPSGDDLLLPTPGASPSQPTLGQGLAVPVPKPKTSAPAGAPASAADEHAKMLVENRFPSASTCATCHPTQFRQWSVSQHAYAQISPVFNTMQATIDKRTSGTNGDFCIRCHTQVGMQLKEPVFISNMDRNPTSREGISCIVCHRVKANYGKVSGRTALAEGDIFEPVYGPKGNAILKSVTPT
jgi:hypothetical protein